MTTTDSARPVTDAGGSVTDAGGPMTDATRPADAAGQGHAARERAFTTLFETHATAVHRYAARRAAAADVEDIVADVFVIAWRKFEQIPVDFELPWLFRTAWNVLANRQRRFVELPFDALPDGPDGGDIANDVIEDVVLRAAWQTLSARDREVLRLVAWDGCNGEQLAAALGITVSGAGVALSRARQRFEQACADASGQA